MYEFKDEYVTGIESVDAEHKRLFEIADEAYQLTKEELLVDKYDQVRHILGELKDYALKHFEHEEAYMASINYKHMFIQKVQHDQFREKISDMNLEHLDENTDEMLKEILDYLTNWLIHHILEH
ncbi:MAG: hemerythrin domain-containing protein, partial [Lachnospiraceae bacterium]|nr:hemerythrin domain-containing protein [Lachnospiraceae bacterium]